MAPDSTGAPLTLSLFGPFEARVRGAPLPRLRSRKGHWLLSLLALRHDRDLDRAWIAGTLWPDSTEPLAARSLRTSLADLRRALGAEAVRLRSPTPRTLSLDLTGATVDLLAFDGALRRGDRQSLEEAVALYRGPLLESCAEEWVVSERQARERGYLQALERLAAHAMADENPGAAEAYLRRVLAVDPLREGAQRSLMQALAAAGNYAAVLHSYRDLRLLLQRELRAEPDAETTALFRQLREEASRRAATGVARPPDLGLPRAAVAPTRARASNLPVQLTSFVGRERELTALRSLLLDEQVRLVTLTGAGGTGKTRLGLQAASGLLDAFPDGVVFVELAPIRDPNLVPAAMLQTLGIHETAGQSRTDRLKEYLREKWLLLLLDNFEQVLAAAPAVAEVLAAAPRVTVLVTSRAPLRVRGEREFPVPPLELVAPSRSAAPELLSRCPAGQLFVDRTRDVQPDFAITNENAPAVSEICRCLDGLPLAIELAAARIRLLPPEALAAHLSPRPLRNGEGAGSVAWREGRSNRLTLLTGGARDLPARQQTLRNTIAWSHDLLEESEQRLFRRLAVFAGGFSVEAVEAVCGGDEDLGPDLLDGLTSLLEQNLLRRQLSSGSSPSPAGSGTGNLDAASKCRRPPVGSGEPRLMMLETIREYARERLAESGEEAALRRRHAEYFLSLAERAEPELRQAAREAWLDRLRMEQENLRAALDWAVACGEPDLGLRLAGALGEFWALRKHAEEGWQRFRTLLAMPGAEERTVARAKALYHAGDLVCERLDLTAAQLFHEESLSIYREQGETVGIAASLWGLGRVASYQGRSEVARSLLEESLALCRETGDRIGMASSLLYLGVLAFERNDLETARALYGESLSIGRDLGYRWAMYRPLRALGEVAYIRGDWAAARSHLEESLTLRYEIGYAVQDAIHSLGGMAVDQGEWETARTLFEQVLRWSQENGDRKGVGNSLLDLGRLALYQGCLGEARRLFLQGYELYQEIGLRWHLAQASVRLGDVAYYTGDDEGAAESFQKGLAVCREHGDTWALIETLGRLGRLSFRQHDLTKARSCFEQGLTMWRQAAREWRIVGYLEGLAAVLGAQGEPERAARLFGAASAVRECLSTPVPPIDRAEFDRGVSATRAQLGPERFAAVWAEGRAMTLEQAVDFALNASRQVVRDPPSPPCPPLPMLGEGETNGSPSTPPLLLSGGGVGG